MRCMVAREPRVKNSHATKASEEKIVAPKLR
jgi:hypothetical protein